MAFNCAFGLGANASTAMIHLLRTHQGCHPDRSAGEVLVPPEISGAEWRDPEIPSPTMLRQGILPVGCPSEVGVRDMPG